MFERSPKTLQMLDLFRGTNDVLSYETITGTMGEDLDSLRSTMYNVRKYLERDEGIVFECVPRVGYRRLSDAEKVQSSGKFQRAIRRTAGRGVQRLDAVSDTAALSNADQLTATIRRAVFQAVQREAGEPRK